MFIYVNIILFSFYFFVLMLIWIKKLIIILLLTFCNNKFFIIFLLSPILMPPSTIALRPARTAIAIQPPTSLTTDDNPHSIYIKPKEESPMEGFRHNFRVSSAILGLASECCDGDSEVKQNGRRWRDDSGEVVVTGGDLQLRVC